MKQNLKFELNDDMLDEVAGGYLMEDDATDGRVTTYVRTTRVRCSKCGTNNGILFAWPSKPQQGSYILCANEANHLDVFDFSKILVDNPQPGDYTVG